MKFKFNLSDENYRHCKNYDGTNYYNFPVSISVRKTGFATRLILPIGSSDSRYTKVDGDTLFIVAENNNLDYISLVVINTLDGSIESVYLGGEDISVDYGQLSYGLLEMELDEQIKILSEYL